ncbi:MAG: outer membrane protein assembly factor BamC [Aquabacterium sp.]|nr:outer membrane protein assembly factor BamC [Aquabacterium sp.]
MPIKQRHQTTFVLSVAALASALATSGCSSVGDTLSGDKVDYRTSGTQSVKLDVPPDLSQLPGQTRYGQVASASVSANNMLRNDKADAPASLVAPTQASGIKLERQGQIRWLSVNQAPEQLWDQVRTFWAESGFELTTDKPEIGILETNWSENMAKQPQDGVIRKTLGRVFDMLHDTGERDQYRTRIERTATGSEIYISHRGLSEEYDDINKKDRTTWRARPSDAGLEAEFLSRLMAKLGASKDAVAAVKADKPATPAASSQAQLNADGLSLNVSADFDTTWRRVGLALDRSGFTVENRDRKQGTYEVRLSDTDIEASKPGFFSRLFSSTPANQDGLSRYSVVVTSKGKTSLVSVINDKGQSVNSSTAKRITKQLLDELS